MNNSSTYIQISYLYVSSNLLVKCRKCFVNGFKEKLLKTDSIEDLLFFNICLKDSFYSLKVLNVLSITIIGKDI